MLECLLFAPLCAGLLMLLLGNTTVCRGLLLLTAVLHTALSVKLAADVSGGLHPQALAGLLAPDALGTLFLVLASVLFLVASVYGVGYLRDEAPEDQQEEAMTIDVSAGGLAMYLNDYPDVGEALQVKLPAVRVDGQRYELPVQLGIVCWLRQAPKGSLFRNACGIQFRYADELEREAMKEYMEHVRAKYKI